MMKRLMRILATGSAAAGLALAGCGPAEQQAPTATLSGSATVDASANAAVAVTLKDASAPAQEKETTADADGSFSFDVSGLTPPFLVRVAPAGGTPMFALADDAGRTSVNPLSTVAVRGVALGENGDDYYQRFGRGCATSAQSLRRLLVALQAELQPLLDLYGVTSLAAPTAADLAALKALFAAVRITLAGGNVQVLNRATGAVIYAGPLSDPASGTFHPENLPPAPGGGTACTYTYSAWGSCQPDGTQARTVASSAPAGCTGTPVLSQACTYTPPVTACSYTYSSWGSCQPDGTQARTVLVATPTGCTGTPVLSQACTYTPPVTACTYTYSAWGACQSNSTQTRTVVTATPTGCTGTPVLSQACTYTPPVTACTYTYSAWGACQSNNTQTRTVATATPSGCTGTPVLSQACTYTPPACTYTYSAWGACQSNNTQTRTVATATPSGCTGTPVLSQACTYTPPLDGASLYASKCAGCHGSLASSNLKGKNISVSLIKSKGMTQGLSDAQLQAIVDAVGP